MKYQVPKGKVNQNKNKSKKNFWSASWHYTFTHFGFNRSLVIDKADMYRVCSDYKTHYLEMHLDKKKKRTWYNKANLHIICKKVMLVLIVIWGLFDFALIGKWLCRTHNFLRPQCTQCVHNGLRCSLLFLHREVFLLHKKGNVKKVMVLENKLLNVLLTSPQNMIYFHRYPCENCVYVNHNMEK